MVLLQAITFAVTVGAALSECAGTQCLKHDDEVTSLLQMRTQVEKHSASPPGGQDCLAGLKRFEAVRKQTMTEKDVGHDPLFPPIDTTIAAPGQECGDAAHNIHEDCSKFYHWKSMQQVGKQMGLKNFVTLPNTNQMDYTDIGQGQLGNCYFLAALAAIANRHAALLHQAFPREGQAGYAKNIFMTQWFLNGEPSLVTVDNMIPAGDHGPYFTQPSKDGEWWPVILAKAWAKIFGTYKAVEGGTAQTVVSALTGAPVTSYNHDSKTEAENWKLLQQSAADEDVMIAGSRENAKKYGLASGHAYAVLEVKADFKAGGKSYGSVVQLMNPWRKDNYKGKVANDEVVNGPNHKYGVFTMLLSEYIDAFTSTGVARLRAGSTPLALKAKVDQPFAFQVVNEEAAAGQFSISIYWPNPRMVRPCESPIFESPPSMIFVTDINKAGTESGGESGNHLKTTNQDNTFLGAVNSYTVAVAGEGGTNYTVLLYPKFAPKDAYLKEVSVVLYGPAALSFYGSEWTPTAIVIKSMTPGEACTKLMLPGVGLYERDNAKVTIPSAPTFWSIKKDRFLYLSDTKDIRWGLASASWWDDVRGGNFRRIAGETIPGKKLPCGCDDLPEGVVGMTKPTKCEDVKDDCSDEKLGPTVRQSCPKTCGICR